MMKKNNKEKATYIYMPMGMCLGMLIGMMFENGLAIGLSIGMAVGLILGTYMDNKNNNKLRLELDRCYNMKKYLKLLLLIIGMVVLLVGIDIGSVLFRNKPLFAIKDDCDCLDQVYHGLLYDTYNCWEYSTAQIKPKWEKFSCTGYVNSTLIYGEITELTDNSIIIKVSKSNSSVKINDEIHVSLLNNPTINGANNIIIGQYIRVKPKSIQETYPIMITTDNIDIINRK